MVPDLAAEPQGAPDQVLRPDRAPLLYSLVFGEGVINDATAVALLRAVQVHPAIFSPGLSLQYPIWVLRAKWILYH